jgi:hypothetical protein
MKTSSLELAMAGVEAAALCGECRQIALARVAEVEDPEWSEMLIELMAVSAVLENHWGEPLSRGAHPSWFPAAEASAAWSRSQRRVFLALYREAGEVLLTLGSDGP